MLERCSLEGELEKYGTRRKHMVDLKKYCLCVLFATVYVSWTRLLGTTTKDTIARDNDERIAKVLYYIQSLFRYREVGGYKGISYIDSLQAQLSLSEDWIQKHL
jgi:hypothetical protein